MWYFAWILGVTMAVLLASISAMMCDARECALDEARKELEALQGSKENFRGKDQVAGLLKRL